MKKRKKKPDELEAYRDVTVSDMNVEGMRWYKTPEEREQEKSISTLGLTKKERRAMIKGAYAAMMPAFLIGLVVFCAAFGLLLLYLYLHTKK